MPNKVAMFIKKLFRSDHIAYDAKSSLAFAMAAKHYKIFTVISVLTERLPASFTAASHCC